MGNMEKRSDAIARDLGRIGSVPVTQLNRSPGTWFLARVAETVKHENRLKDSILAYITAADTVQSEEMRPEVSTFSLFGIRTDNRRYIALYHYDRFIGLYKPSKRGLPNSILRKFRKEIKKRGCITVLSNESVYSITDADALPDISIRFMYAPQIYSKTKSARMSARLQKIPLPAAGKCRGPPCEGNSIRVTGVIGLNTDRGTDPAHKSHFKVTITMNLENIVKKLKKGILVPVITAGLYVCCPTPNTAPVIDASLNSEKKIEITVTDDCYIRDVSHNGADITGLDQDDTDARFYALVDAVEGENLIEATDDLDVKAEKVVNVEAEDPIFNYELTPDTTLDYNSDSANELFIKNTSTGIDELIVKRTGYSDVSAAIGETAGFNLEEPGLETFTLEYVKDGSVLKTETVDITKVNSAPEVNKLYEKVGSEWLEITDGEKSVMEGNPLRYRVELADKNSTALELKRFIDTEWGTTQMTSDSLVPNDGDIWISQDPDSDGSNYLYEIRMNVKLGLARGPPYLMQDKAKETEYDLFESTPNNLNVYVQ